MDNTLEITLWFVFTLMVGFLILNFIFNINYNTLSNDIKNLFTHKNEIENNSLNTNPLNFTQFFFKTIDFWKNCGYGEIQKEIYLDYNSSKILNESTFFKEVKKYNLNYIIKDNKYDCSGIDELFIEGNISGNKFVLLKCDPKTGRLIILKNPNFKVPNIHIVKCETS